MNTDAAMFVNLRTLALPAAILLLCGCNPAQGRIARQPPSTYPVQLLRTTRSDDAVLRFRHARFFVAADLRLRVRRPSDGGG